MIDKYVGLLVVWMVVVIIIGRLVDLVSRIGWLASWLGCLLAGCLAGWAAVGLVGWLAWRLLSGMVDCWLGRLTAGFVGEPLPDRLAG